VARRRTRLTTVGHVLQELGRQYRRAVNNELPWQDCAAAARVLREMRQQLESNDIEERLAAVEALLAQRQDNARPMPLRGNGHLGARP
jgi:hypothetical protein